MSALAVLPPIGRFGRYDILGRLATGGVAEIYLGRMTGPQQVSRYVVVKRITPGLSEHSVVQRDFLHEAKLTLRLSHPNLVAVYDVGEDEGALYLAMEWVRGVSLHRVIEVARTHGGVPVPLAVVLFADLAGALQHVHTATDDQGRALRIVHRDVTPENVILGWNGIAKLLDFGIAKSDAGPQKTDAGVVKGKYGYIAPEQWKGEAVDGRGDVFALSVCLYETLTGKPPYQRATPMETMAAILLDPAIPSVRAVRPEVPEALDAIVQRGLAKDPAQRYASAAAMRADLEALRARLAPELRDPHVARFLQDLFPGEAQRDPTLDRKPPTRGITLQPVRAEAPRSLDVFELEAEAELEGDQLLADARSRQRTIFLFVVLLVLGTLAFVVFNAARS